MAMRGHWIREIQTQFSSLVQLYPICGWCVKYPNYSPRDLFGKLLTCNHHPRWAWLDPPHTKVGQPHLLSVSTGQEPPLSIHHIHSNIWLAMDPKPKKTCTCRNCKCLYQVAMRHPLEEVPQVPHCHKQSRNTRHQKNYQPNPFAGNKDACHDHWWLLGQKYLETAAMKW